MDAMPGRRPAPRRPVAAALAAVVFAAAAAASLVGWAAWGTEDANRARPLLVERPAVGVQFHATWDNYKDGELAVVADRLARAGVRWVRIDIGWRSLEPRQAGTLDPWYLERSDRAITVAHERGLKVLATLWSTPRWANGGRAGKVPPEDPADYAAIAERAAARWRGRVTAWEVWNEPNHDDFWKGRRPDTYAALVRAAYPAFKRGDPGALVVAGSVAFNDVPWLEAMYDAGAGGSFDVLSTHPYTVPSDRPPEDGDPGEIESVNHLHAVRALMDARGDARKDVWATEFGWSSHATEPGAEPWEQGVSRQRQADYLVRAIRLFAKEHPRVPVVFWYRERDHETSDVHFAGFGLLTYDLQPKPAYRALRDLLVGR